MGTNKNRKRAPGGGRKPKGRFAGNTERFNVRCTPEIKGRLEMEALKNKRSLPQEIQERLQRTFEYDADNSRDPATAGLIFMVEFAAREFGGGRGGLPAWRTNAVEFEEFKAAIDIILERLRPAGKAKKLLSKTSGQPNSLVSRAKMIEWSIFDMKGLDVMPKELTDHYRRGRKGQLPNFDLKSDTARNHARYMETQESRSDALRALGLKK
jgi:hypothetical protein